MKPWGWIVVALWLVTGRIDAQNVSGYATIPEPLLFMLREPAVHDDLRLTDNQRQELISLNESFDGQLLGSRNQPPDQGRTVVLEVLAKSREQIARLFTTEQQQRLQQIAYQLRGLPLVLLPEPAKQLGLTDQQRTEIEALVAETLQQISEVSSQTYQGPEAHQKTEKTVLAAQQRQHDGILAILDETQKRQLRSLIGRPFDTTQLGRVTFKAPELADGDQWVNSSSLKLSDLQGKVVALHFWAFGCGNCHQNYRWYRDWGAEFEDQAFAILGVHTPETPAERNPKSVRAKVREASFDFPVVIDNDKRNWDAWGNSMWPSVYLIDKRGRLRYWWYGELNWNGAGGQKIMAQKIQELLAE